MRHIDWAGRWFPMSSLGGCRRLGRRKLQYSRRIGFEPLEDRRLLATLTVNTWTDNLTAGDGLVTLREAIAAANGNTTTDLGDTGSGADTIVFDPTVFATSRTIALALGQLQITEAVAIQGTGRDLLSIDGQLQSRIFNVTATTGEVALSGMTFTRGKTTGDGGAILQTGVGTQLSVSDCTISGNSAVANGGGVATTGPLTVTNSTISGNTLITGRGAGIFGGKVTLVNSAISGEVYCSGDASLAQSTISGAGLTGAGIDCAHSSIAGGIFQKGPVTLLDTTIGAGGISYSYSAGSGPVTLTDSTVTGTVGTGGGDITLVNSMVTGGDLKHPYASPFGVFLTDSHLIGGDIHLIGHASLGRSKITLTRSNITGGSVYAKYISISLDSSTITGSDQSGIVILDYADEVKLTNSSITNCKGDGIESRFNGKVFLKSSEISGNAHFGIRMSFYRAENTVVATDSKINDNGACGIYINFNGTVTLDSCEVIGNGHSGGPYDTFGGISTSEATIANSTIANNWKLGQFNDGGGIYAQRLTLTSSTISGNKAGRYGGGISSARATIVDSTISGNSANAGGGIVSITLEVINSTVSGNTATQMGGGIMHSPYGTPDIQIKYSTITDNQAPSGGGIWQNKGQVAIEGSIVAGNGGGSSPDIKTGPGTLSVAHDLIGDKAGTALSESHVPDVNGNLIGSSTGVGIINPMLGPLAYNGSWTKTHALLAGSPAIDAIPYVALPDGVVHQYTLDSSFADTLGGPALAGHGGTLPSGGYDFGPNQGLSLASAAINPEEYSIELKFSWDALSGGWQKIIDFKNLTADTGLYALGDGLRFESQAYQGGVFAPGGLVRLVLTRDAASDVVRAYINGAEVWNFVDAAGDAVFSGPDHVMQFFIDDNASGGAESQAGFVDYVRIYDRVLAANEISQLDDPGLTPEIPNYDQRGFPYARVVDSGGGPRIDMGAFERQMITPAALPGDYNLNGIVDAADYTVWRDTLGSTVAPFQGADGNGDGIVDKLDYQGWKSNFGRRTPPSAGQAAVGEVAPLTTGGSPIVSVEPLLTAVGPLDSGPQQVVPSPTGHHESRRPDRQELRDDLLAAWVSSVRMHHDIQAGRDDASRSHADDPAASCDAAALQVASFDTAFTLLGTGHAGSLLCPAMGVATR